VAIAFPGKKNESSHLVDFDTFSVVLYYRQFSIMDLQLIGFNEVFQSCSKSILLSHL